MTGRKHLPLAWALGFVLSGCGQPAVEVAPFPSESVESPSAAEQEHESRGHDGRDAAESRRVSPSMPSVTEGERASNEGLRRGQT